MRQIERQRSLKPAASPPKRSRRLGGLSCWHGHSPTAAEAAAAAFRSSILTATSPQVGVSCVHPSSQVHAQVGLWAIDTVNANAWPNFAAYLQRTSADVVVGQEAKRRLGDEVDSAVQSMRAHKWRGNLHPCASGPAGGPSAGTVVTVRQHLGLGLHDGVPDPDHHPSPRFQLQKVSAVCQAGLHVGSAYLQDVIGPTAPANRELLERVAATLNSLGGPWILGGDFNATPEALRNTGFLDLVDGVFQAPTDPTCGPRVLDYFIVSRSLSPAVFAVHVVADGAFSPHSPVRLFLRASPRSLLCRRLKAPRGFGAHLPYGPHTEDFASRCASAGCIASATSTAAVDLQSDFESLVNLVEDLLCEVSGLDADEAAKHKGRAVGPTAAWVSQLPPSQERSRVSSATRAWGLTLKWLRTLAALPADSKGAGRLRLAVCRHPHQGARSASFCTFELWQSQLGVGMLEAPPLLYAFTNVAAAMFDSLQAEDDSRCKLAWDSWINDGPAAGLRRQHMLSRVATGWVPSSPVICDDELHDEEEEDRDGDMHGDCHVTEQMVLAARWRSSLEWQAPSRAVTRNPSGDHVVDEHLPAEPHHESNTSVKPSWPLTIADHAPAGKGAAPHSRQAAPCPATLQQAVDQEADSWDVRWGRDAQLPVPQWPADLGPLPSQMRLHELKECLRSFPAHLGLGWDGIHPKALLRLSDAVLTALLRVLFICEATGTWPKSSALVIIALLPKSSPGFRPIGLFPWLPKIWAKLRRGYALQWEQSTDRDFIYAGPGKGADHAAWKQAARAEHAATVRGAHYGSTLLDLVKAFDMVPHHVLVREAIRLGYSLWILRLSIAAYAAERMIRIDGVLSRAIPHRRSLTAGSGLATTEMRIVLVNVIEAAMRVAPLATPTLYVDDLSVEVCGTQAVVVTQLHAFTSHFCDSITADGGEVSTTKSLCTASSPSLGRRIAGALARYGIQYKDRVVSLGSALGGGRRRNAQVIAKRLQAFRRRLPRMRKLVKAKVCTKRILRTGGIASLTYGQAVTGVATTVLLHQRRAAAHAAAPASGPGGQDLDLALIIADGPRQGRADPAHDAHCMPIFAWAQAVWNAWLPRNVLERLADTAITTLSAARSIWQNVKGPAAATVASAWRLEWTVHSANQFTTDQGRLLNLDLDPPVVIKRECYLAVRRWRERAIFDKFPHLGPFAASHGLHTAPLWRAMRGKGILHDWGAAQKGSLLSAFAGRQWPQDRCWVSNTADHDRCMLCVDPGAALAAAGVEPDAARIDAAPVGTLQHRICECPQLRPYRLSMGPNALVQPQLDGTAIHGTVLAAHSTGLFPLPRLELPDHQRAPHDGSFEWTIRPDQSGLVSGVFYTDGSRIASSHPDTTRLGWSFVVLDRHNHTIAAAHGSPPAFVTDIPGAEAWAILQAVSVAILGSSFRSDCKPCIDALHAGRRWACAADRPLARVFNLIFPLIDDVPLTAFVWMPAHTWPRDVGVRRIGNGQPLTFADRRGNDEADQSAKLAAARYAVDPAVVQQLKNYDEQVHQAFTWLGRASYAATHFGPSRQRDSTASRRQAARAKAQAAQPPSSLPSGANQRRGTPLTGLAKASLRWARSNAARLRALPTQGDVGSKKHYFMQSGGILWCNHCGAYAGAHGVGISKACPGKVDLAAAGGRAQQLRQLRKNKHPKTRATLPAAIRHGEVALESISLSSDARPRREQDARSDEDALRRTVSGRRRLRLRARLAGLPPPAEPQSTPASASPTAARKRALTRQLVAAAMLGSEEVPSPVRGAPSGSSRGPLHGASPAPPKRARLGSRTPVPARGAPASSASCALPVPAPSATRQQHPALRRSRLPPSHVPKRAHPGAASPSHAEILFVPQPDLDCRLRQAEQAMRAARRSARAASSRPAWRPLALRPAAVPPVPPRSPPPVGALPCAATVAPPFGCLPPVAIPLPALPPRGRIGILGARLPPPPVSPDGHCHGTPA